MTSALMLPADAPFKLNVPMLLRLNMFHLLQAVSPHSIGLDIGVPARGWTVVSYEFNAADIESRLEMPGKVRDF